MPFQLTHQALTIDDSLSLIKKTKKKKEKENKIKKENEGGLGTSSSPFINLPPLQTTAKTLTPSIPSLNLPHPNLTKPNLFVSIIFLFPPLLPLSLSDNNDRHSHTSPSTASSPSGAHTHHRFHLPLTSNDVYLSFFPRHNLSLTSPHHMPATPFASPWNSPVSPTSSRENPTTLHLHTSVQI